MTSALVIDAVNLFFLVFDEGAVGGGAEIHFHHGEAGVYGNEIADRTGFQDQFGGSAGGSIG
jgi:hypothetical protein